MPLNCRSDYLHGALNLDMRKLSIENLVKDITKFGLDKFDTIAFRGMSGALLAPSIADSVKKELLMVRKNTENSHSCWSIEGYTEVTNYIIIDDLINSGMTMKSIINSIENDERFENPRKCVGIFLYREVCRPDKTFWHKSIEIPVIGFNVHYYPIDERNTKLEVKRFENFQ